MSRTPGHGLLVVGGGGEHSWPGGVARGRTAQAVVHGATVPVLLARTPPPGTRFPDRIVVATDGSAAAQRGLHLGLAVCEEHRAKIALLLATRNRDLKPAVVAVPRRPGPPPPRSPTKPRDAPSGSAASALPLGSEWRREALRINLWVVPSIEVIAAVALYVATHALDKAAYDGSVTLPSWMIFGTADAARQILTTLAAAVITVVGIVFSITIVTLTLASTQFGPRMLRNFIRDRGTQFTLDTFVATFVYATLVLISIGPGDRGKDFVSHLSITLSVGLVTFSMAVLIYFIHHIATSIQLPQVIASIARDLSRAIDADSDDDGIAVESGPSVPELLRRMTDAGGTGAGSVDRLPAVRQTRDADGVGRREGRGDPPPASAGALPGGGSPDGDRVAPQRDRVRQ